MKTFINILAVLILVTSVNAQKITRSTISSGSLHTSKITAIVGQTITSTLTSDYNVLTQGFLQPYSSSHTSLPVMNEVKVSVYPNPVIDILNIESENPVNYSIYNTNGILVLSGNTQFNSSIDLSNQISGIYIVLIEKAVFKIIKQ